MPNGTAYNSYNRFSSPAFSTERTNMPNDLTEQLIPSKKIKRSDLELACRLEGWSSEILMHTIAVIQSLEEGESIALARELGKNTVGKYVRVISTDTFGTCTDIDNSEDRRACEISMVVDGKILKVRHNDLIVTRAPAPQPIGYIPR